MNGDDANDGARINQILAQKYLIRKKKKKKTSNSKKKIINYTNNEICFGVNNVVNYITMNI